MAGNTVERDLRDDDRCTEGHFPGDPIIPGAVLLREVARALSADGTEFCHEIRAAKFLHPVRPGDRLTIAWQPGAAGEIGFVCSAGTPPRRVVVGTLRLRPR